MANLLSLVVYTKEVDEGRWLAATGAAPYFCFESDSEEGVLELTKRALQFYKDELEDILEKLETHRERGRTIPTFDRKHTISAKELVAA